MTHPMLTWLEERLAEAEEFARAAIRPSGTGNWSDDYFWPDPEDTGDDAYLSERIDNDEMIIYDEGGHTALQARHIAYNDPRSVLADIAAKRLIIGYHSGSHKCSGEVGNCMWIPADEVCDTVRALASACPGYDPSWGPQ